MKVISKILLLLIIVCYSSNVQAGFYNPCEDTENGILREYGHRLGGKGGQSFYIERSCKEYMPTGEEWGYFVENDNLKYKNEIVQDGNDTITKKTEYYFDHLDKVKTIKFYDRNMTPVNKWIYNERVSSSDVDLKFYNVIETEYTYADTEYGVEQTVSRYKNNILTDKDIFISGKKVEETNYNEEVRGIMKSQLIFNKKTGERTNLRVFHELGYIRSERIEGDPKDGYYTWITYWDKKHADPKLWQEGIVDMKKVYKIKSTGASEIIETSEYSPITGNMKNKIIHKEDEINKMYR